MERKKFVLVFQIMWNRKKVYQKYFERNFSFIDSWEQFGGVKKGNFWKNLEKRENKCKERIQRKSNKKREKFALKREIPS